MAGGWPGTEFNRDIVLIVPIVPIVPIVLIVLIVRFGVCACVRAGYLTDWRWGSPGYRVAIDACVCVYVCEGMLVCFVFA
jgi:hypothetical protein